MCLVVSGIALRTLATRGRKRAGPTSAAKWEGCSEAEGPKDDTAYDSTKPNTSKLNVRVALIGSVAGKGWPLPSPRAAVLFQAGRAGLYPALGRLYYFNR